MPKQRKDKGRPPRPLPDRIDASPEDIAKAMLSLPADYKWRYLERGEEVDNDNAKK